jgi:hypothetical protein
MLFLKHFEASLYLKLAGISGILIFFKKLVGTHVSSACLCITLSVNAQDMADHF